jgi:hypothetical protein
MLGNHRICSLAARQASSALHTTIRSVIFVVLALAGTSFAQNQYYVSPIGSDSNPGTQTQPWQTIQHAVNSFSQGANGTTIHVEAGTYSDLNNCQTSGYTNVNVCVGRGGSSSTARLVLQCDAQWSVPSSSGCLLRGNNSTQGISVEANNVDVVGFDYGNVPNAFTGIGTFCAAVGSPGPCAQGNSVHILSNYVHDIGQTANDQGAGGAGCPGDERGSGIDVGRHGGYSVSGAQVIGNRVTTIGSQAMKAAGTCNFTHGIYMDAPDGVTENNIVEDVAAAAIEIYSYPCNNVITNNIVLRAGHSGINIAGGDCANITPVQATGLNTVNNNILDYNGYYGIMIGTGNGGICEPSDPILISNNLMYGNGEGNYNGTSGCASPVDTLSENPTSTFVQYLGNSNDNLQLQPTSVAVGGGTSECVSPTPCVPLTDFDGLTRPNPPSIGPYELASGGGGGSSGGGGGGSKVPADLSATVE